MVATLRDRHRPSCLSVKGYFRKLGRFFCLCQQYWRSHLSAGWMASFAEPDPRVFEAGFMQSALGKIGISGIQDIALRKVGSKSLLDPLLAKFAIPANSDYFPVLDQNAARCRFLGSSAEQFSEFTNFPLPVQDFLGSRFVREEERTKTTFSTNNLLQVQMAFQAMELRDYLLTGDWPSKHQSIPEVQRKIAIKFREQYEKCGAVDDKTRFISLFSIMSRIIPFLQPSEIAAICSTLENAPCAGQLNQQERGWINLFKAIGSRDAAAVAESPEFCWQEMITWI